MDGRVHLPRMCRIPMGILTPYRNIGGMFNIAWPGLQPLIAQDVAMAERRGSGNLFIGTYHFSKSDPSLGCAGHGYNDTRALDAAEALVREMRELFTDHAQQVQSVLMGIETDEDALILHDRFGGRICSTGDLIDHSVKDILALIRQIEPEMPERTANDLTRLIAGNARHVSEIRKEGREPEDREHRERILGIGMSIGFDWLHERNLALIINDIDPELPQWIAKAAGIIESNRTAGRIPDGDAALAIMVPYWELGYVRKMAIVRARYLMELAQRVIQREHPRFAESFKPIMGVVDQNTRQLEILE